MWRRADAFTLPLRRYISTPKAYVDKQNYKYPVGPYQLKKFAEGAAEYGVTNYYEDPNALKLIDQTEWYSVSARSHPKHCCVRTLIGDALALAGPSHVRHQGGARGGRARRGQHLAGLLARACAAHGQLAEVHTCHPNKFSRPLPLPSRSQLPPHHANRRMVPHVFGWFTMTSVWFILFTQLEHARRDISEVSDRNIPEWVFAAIIGTSIIFMSFALVRHPRAQTSTRPTDTHPR